METNNIYTKWLIPKLKKFVSKGYNIKFHPLDNWIKISKSLSERPSEVMLVANAKVFRLPSTFGIKNGHISKLTIEILPDYPNYWHNRENRTEYYHWDRGLDFNKLRQNKEAKKLYDELLEIIG